MCTDIERMSSEKMDRLKEIIHKYEGVPGALIPILNEAQDLFGYLPMEVQELISKELKIPLTEVYGVATFYAKYTLKPSGKYRISLCLGTACYVKGAPLILEKLKEILKIDIGETTSDGLFTLEETRCLGCCALAPVMMINEDVYGKLIPEDVENIIKAYKNRD